MQVPTPAAAMAIRDSLEEEVLIALVRAAWLAAERSNAVTAGAGELADAAKEIIFCGTPSS